MNLPRKHAVVTGGGTGVGEAIALKLADESDLVTILGRRKEPLKIVANKHKNINWKNNIQILIVVFKSNSILVYQAGNLSSIPLDASVFQFSFVCREICAPKFKIVLQSEQAQNAQISVV